MQEQSVIYIQKGLNGTPEVLLDPNKLSNDGSISLGGLAYSNDDKYLCYGISRGGSDWREFYVMDVQTKQLTKDEIKWSKFSGTAWYKDGFYYGRYDEPMVGEELKQKNEFQKIFYHKLGTQQSEDKLIWEDKQNPKRLFGAGVSDDEKFMFLSISEGSSNNNILYYKNLVTDSPITPIVDKFEAIFRVVDNLDDKFWSRQILMHQ